MLGYRLVEQRAFGVAWVVEFGFCSDWHEYCANAQYSAAIARVRKAQGPNRRQFGPCQGSLAADLLARRRHIRAAAKLLRQLADAPRTVVLREGAQPALCALLLGRIRLHRMNN